MKNRFGDVALAACVLAVVVMMITPLTPWLLDLLIGINLALALLTLSMALFIRNPLTFTAFPTVLLVATLYRLALNVSSTRLILLHADAGQIIRGFGGILVGGDILVGAVIFLILAMVLFLVITRGAERVAEVAARFTLDALPGMQLAIDADLRAGAISVLDARRRRADLDQQSKYYGALDGAMKFVRGDAIAGLVIIAVNIVGGLAVGMLRKDMSVGQALDVYGRLTVGDGLVTMIPALLVSTAAGLLVTRVGQSYRDIRLGEQIRRQIAAEPGALFAASVLLLVLALVPGLPAWPFILLGLLLGLGALLAYLSYRRTRGLREQDDIAGPDTLLPQGRTAIQIGGALYEELDPLVRARGGWAGFEQRLTDQLREKLGMPLPGVTVKRANDGLPGRELRLTIRGGSRDQTTVPEESLLCTTRPSQLKSAGITPLGTAGPGKFWISRSDRADELGVLDPVDGIGTLVESWILSRAGQLVGIDEVQRLLDRVALTQPALVRETVPKVIPLAELKELLSALLSDGIGLDHAADVLEAVSCEPKGDDPVDLSDRVRRRLAPLITAGLPKMGGSIQALELDEEVLSVLKSGLTRTARGRRLALPMDLLDRVIQASQRAAEELGRPVLMVPAELRRPLAEMLVPELPGLTVVAVDEIEPHAPVNIVGQVSV